MADFNNERAIARYSELSRLIQAGAYQERDVDGSYGEDGIEEGVENLNFQAAQHGLAFHWHKESDTYTLEPLSDESKAAFLHVNVESLVWCLLETSHYLNRLPFQGEQERKSRAELNTHIERVLNDSYLVPVLREESEDEPVDLVVEQLNRIESPGYNQLGEDEPYYVEPEEDEDEDQGPDLHQCPYCYNLVNSEHEEFCSLNPHRNRNIVP